MLKAKILGSSETVSLDEEIFGSPLMVRWYMNV